jgi:hypothetical protein
MMCPHGLGIGHMLVDLLMAVPFVASSILFLKMRLKKKVNCHTDIKAPDGAGIATFIKK